MNNPSNTRQQLLESLRAKPTCELIELFKAKADPAETEALAEVLTSRNARPDETAPTDHPASTEKTMRPIAADSNASVAQTGEQKLELYFPKNGFIRGGRSRFRNYDELLGYVAESFGFSALKGSSRMKIKRRGKYQRLDSEGSPIFTFGDPVLDLITDERGWVSVGNENYDLMRRELDSTAERKGGIASIDLALAEADLGRELFADGTSLKEKSAVIEYNATRAIVATNPSSIKIRHGSAVMRFRSWKRSYGFYSSIGSEIETWGRNFSTAEIRSTYADSILDSNPFICFIVKIDSDSDTNDDYVDEYEWAVNAQLPSTVVSTCRARWFSQPYEGTVSKGPCVAFF